MKNLIIYFMIEHMKGYNNGCDTCKFHKSKYELSINYKSGVVPYCSKNEIENFKKWWNIQGLDNQPNLIMDCYEPLKNNSI